MLASGGRGSTARRSSGSPLVWFAPFPVRPSSGFILASFSDLVFDARIAARSLAEGIAGLAHPTLRVGVTGLSRSGKTVFITALVHALMRGARLPVFRAMAEGRIVKAELAHQPDDAVPRFAYEDHLAALTGPDRHWPDSTRRIAELRLTIRYESREAWSAGPHALTLDIVDYPGEWLLDLGLLDKSFAAWSRESLAACRSQARAEIAKPDRKSVV